MFQSISAFVVCCAGLWVAALNTRVNSELLKNLIFGIIVGVVMQLGLALVMWTCGWDSWLVTAYAAFGIVICGIYIVIDLLQIMTPSGMPRDEYILGALNLYLDMVRLFIYILIELGK